MFTTVAFYESIDPAAAWTQLAGVADPHVRVVGDDIQIPSLSQIVALAGGAENTVEPQMRLVTPSLREKSLYKLVPLNVAAAAGVEPTSHPRVIDLREIPLPLVPGEQLNAEVNSNPAAAQVQWMIAWLADGPIVPVKGSIFTVRCTGATTLVAGAWTNVALTFDEDLPRGRYQIMGMHAQSAGCIAARLQLVGGGWRPGCLGADGPDDGVQSIFRNGQFGVFGEFEDIEPPTIDYLSLSADTAEVIYLDLIQVRKGPG